MGRALSLLLPVAVGLFLAWDRTSDADTGRPLADAAFEEGARLMDAKRYDDACGRFAESDRLSPSGRAVYNLAACEEKRGHLRAAHADYEEALRRAAARPDLKPLIAEKSASVEARVPTLIVKLASRTGEESAWTVDVDGEKVPQASLGRPTRLDPGEHRIRASRDKEIQEAMVGLREGQKNVEVAVAVDNPSGRVEIHTVVVERPPPRTAAWVLTAAGAAGVAAGAVFGLLAMDRKAALSTACPEGACSTRASWDTAHEANTDAKTYGWISTAAVGVGAALAATGVALLLTSKSPPAASALVLSPGMCRAVLSGAF